MLLDHFAEQDIPCVVRQNAFSSIVDNCLLSILAVETESHSNGSNGAKFLA